MATTLSFAGAEIPPYLHSRTLPGLGIEGAAPRDRFFGALAGVWCLFDGRYKLSKFNTGDVHLFDLENDPQEQHNLAGKPGVARIQADLDRELTARMMAGIVTAGNPHRVYYSDLSQELDFGREGWIRPFPRSIRDAYE
jgi:arylsulfatase A-like enzyme